MMRLWYDFMHHFFYLLQPLQFQGGLKLGRQLVVKINAEPLSQHDENMLYRPHLVWLYVTILIDRVFQKEGLYVL
jgi:hypothetical protein